MTRTFFKIMRNGDNMIKEKLRSEIKEEDKWDLTGLYKTEDEWNKEYDELQGSFRGRRVLYEASHGTSEFKKVGSFCLL